MNRKDPPNCKHLGQAHKLVRPGHGLRKLRIQKQWNTPCSFKEAQIQRNYDWLGSFWIHKTQNSFKGPVMVGDINTPISLTHLYWGHHIYTPPPGLRLEEIRKWLVYANSWCIWKLSDIKRNTQGAPSSLPTGARRAPVVVFCFMFEQFAYSPADTIHRLFSFFF